MKRAVFAALMLAACGRTPTQAPPCTAMRATAVDTVWTKLPNGQRVVAAIKYECRS